MKKFLIKILTILLMLSYSQTALAIKGYEYMFILKFKINSPYFYLGTNIHKIGSTDEEVVPFIDGDTDRAYLPVRIIGERRGFDVVWEEEGKKIIFTKGEEIIEFAIGSTDIRISRDRGETWEVKKTDAVPVIRRDRSFLPMRVMAELVGYSVYWREDTQEIILISAELMENEAYIRQRITELKDENDYIKFAIVANMYLIPEDELLKKVYVNFKENCDEEEIEEALGEKATIIGQNDITGSYNVEYSTVEEMMEEVIRLNELSIVNYADPHAVVTIEF